MKTAYTKRFSKQLNGLPQSVQDQFAKQEALFKDNHRHPSLNFKKLTNMNDAYSIRITVSYRALFILTEDACVFFAVGHRKDIYR